MCLTFIILLTLQIFALISAQSSTASPLASIKSINCTEFSTSKETWITYNGINHCYYIPESYYSTKTYQSALDICRFKNATLASIHNSTINYLLSHRDFGQGYTEGAFWIGLNSLLKRGIYKWTDNSPVQFTNFTNVTSLGDVIPTDVLEQGRCVAIRTIKTNQYTNRHDIGAWFKEDCTEQFNYICERSIVEEDPVTPTPPTPGNCEQGWSDYADKKCIKYINGSMNFDQAKRTCINMKGELLSIHSEEEQDFVTALVAGLQSPYIGFRKKSSASFKWDDQAQINYTNWGMDVYKHTYSEPLCAVIVTNKTQPGNWIKVRCTDQYPAICEKMKDPANPNPGITNKCKISGFDNFIEYRNSCYYLVDSPSNFSNFYGAEANCQAMNGAHLVSIVDPFERAFLKYNVKQFGKSDIYWIGLDSSDTNETQIFEWTDQWPVYYTYWDKNEPTFAGLPREECVALHKSNSTWKTTFCDNQFAYICKTTTNPFPKLNADKSGVCPQLRNVTDKSLKWVDIDKRSQYCYWFSVDSESRLSSGIETWSDASFHCHRRNGTLLSIHSEHELMLLRNKLTEPDSGYHTWIGLSTDFNGDFAWEDGSALDFTNWDPNESIVTGSSAGSSLCVDIEPRQLLWKSSPCSGYYSHSYFICQTKKLYNKSATVQPLSTPSKRITSISGVPNMSSTPGVRTGSSQSSSGTDQSSRSVPTTIKPMTKEKNSGDSGKGLSSGQKAGIAVGIVGGIVLLLGIGFILMKKFRPNSSVVTKLENSLYSRNRNDSQALPTVRWSKRS